MANLDRLPDTLEYQDIRYNIRAHLIVAMGQTATLLKRVQAISYTEVFSDQTHRSRTSPRPSRHRRSRSPVNDRRKDTHRDNHGRDPGNYHEQRRGRGQEVNQDRDSSPHTFDKSYGPAISSLRSLKSTMARRIPKTGSLFMRSQSDQQQETSTSWQTIF